ncbi:Uu.00g023590.m01.CDS01 [Anthostomella pinea]|uniref:Uu.00g023590.m01.CDS01 n=1 Tax=Anthostomella pinea TaxID=933095 RepID=A0AAI8YR29_9PEZI|nr:Uu.00g023590.m01.CDS01 [Anthostomella pinea]
MWQKSHPPSADSFRDRRSGWKQRSPAFNRASDSESQNSHLPSTSGIGFGGGAQINRGAMGEERTDIGPSPAINAGTLAE